VRVSLAWLREFVDLPESIEELRATMDDLGLVVEGVEEVGVGLEDVVVARVEEIRAIKGADRIRLAVVEAGEGPVEIVCGASNFVVGNHVPLAPVGAVLPGGFAIEERTLRGVTSHGMLCSRRELRLGEDHEGLMVLDGLIEPRLGEGLTEALGIEPDVVFDISVEGNRPDAWSIEGVARDLAARFQRSLREPALATPNVTTSSDSFAHAAIDAPDLCGRLTVSVLRRVRVAPSPPWVIRRLEKAGMRPISNVVDASNLVMLELGQPTHPYDAAQVAGRTLSVRRARAGETLTTLDGVERTLATTGRGLGDTGEDCVIVDGEDRVIGLAGIMGGASSEIGPDTTDVLLEAAFFDPMTIARSSKRHGLRSEASNRFERGVDPQLGLRAAARFVEILRASAPDLEWLADPLDVRGTVPTPPTISLAVDDIERLLGVRVSEAEAMAILRALDFSVATEGGKLSVTTPSRRLDVREGALGRADVIEEIARLYSYRRVPRHFPAWAEAGGLTARQQLRRRLRDIVVDAGALEAWTATLGSDRDFDVLHPGLARVRVTNPLAEDESVLRASMLTGLVRAWSRNFERGVGDVILAEFGNVFLHPSIATEPRLTPGGAGGTLTLALPQENERLTILLGRPEDDAARALALWSLVSGRLGLADVVVRATSEAPRGLHPTRAAALVDRATEALLGYLGEVDSAIVEAITGTTAPRRLGLIDLDLDALADSERATRVSPLAQLPTRYPSALIDLAFVTPRRVNAGDLGHALRQTSELVENVALFDVYEGSAIAEGSRSLAFRVRLSSRERTLDDEEVSAQRAALIETAASLGATLR